MVAQACEIIEANSGKDSQNITREILSNLFRSAIVLKPKELTQLFYFFLTKLGPEYEALETGIGPELLNKAVSKSTGKELKAVRAELKKTGDLGQVAMMSKKTTKTLSSMFSAKKKETPLTLKKVMDTFMTLSQTSGGSSVNKKLDMMVSLIRSSKGPETKYIVRWLQKNLKIGA